MKNTVNGRKTNVKLNYKIMNVNVRVEKKNQIRNMAGSFMLSIDDQKCEVSYSKQQDKTIQASLVPQNLAAFQQLPKKMQKDARHTAADEIRRRIG